VEPGAVYTRLHIHSSFANPQSTINPLSALDPSLESKHTVPIQNNPTPDFTELEEAAARASSANLTLRQTS
jgi:hypothetical protein